MPRPTAREEIRGHIAHVRRFGASVVMGIPAEHFEAMVPHILRGADMEDRERERKRRERLMTTQTTKPAPSLTAQLFARDAQAVEAQRGAAARAYRRVLDKKAAPDNITPGNIVAALEAERRALAACDGKVRPALMAVLDKYPAPPAAARKIIADQVRAIRNMAQGALNTLDNNPARLGHWITKITEIPDNVGSPENLAEAHWDHIRCLLGCARGLPAVPADLAAVAQIIETLTARLLANDVPAMEVSRGSGPLPETLEHTPKARGSYRAKTEVNHDDF